MVAVFIIVYTFAYRNQQIDSVVGAGNYLISKFPTSTDEAQMDEFEAQMDEFVVVNNISVLVFTADEVTAETDFNEVTVVYTGLRNKDDGKENENMRAIRSKYFSTIAKSEEKTFYFVVNNKKYDGMDIVVGGIKDVNGKKVYFYVQSFIKDKDFATNFFYQLFVGMTIIGFGVSVLYAFFVGKRISYPLVKLSQEVREKGRNPEHVITLSGYETVEIEELAHSLEYSVSEQKKTEEFRRDLVANVSHDLRTPLTMIKAYAEMIRDLSGNNPQKREQHCEIIINEVDTLNLLVSDLLDLSKLQAGTVELDIKCISLGYLVQTVLKRLNMYVERDGYEFITDIDENLTCDCDSKHMEQAIYNLVCNAINYTGEDKKIYISIKENNGKIRFSVRDTGKGIKPEEIDRIWDRYYRANQTKRSVAGSGIGLSIVQNVLLCHGMDYGVDSEVGKGTTFWFETKESENENEE